MVTLFITLIAVSFLLLSVSYRHALLFAKAGTGRLLFVSAVFAIMNTLMSWLALLFANAIGNTMFFNSLFVSIGVLVILSFKAYFNTRRSKLAEAVFDITSFRFMFFLSLATSFEMFMAMTAVALLLPNMVISLSATAGLTFLFFMLGLLAGRRPNQLTSIRVFILFASVLYFLSALSVLLYLF